MDSVKSAIFSVLLLLDGVIYDFVCYIYEIFYALADINIFSEEAYNEITTKIYVILGLIMMFVLAYSLLKAVINPDDYAKGEQSITKLIPNVIISLVIIVLLPTVFEFAMNFQHAVLTNNTIYKLFLDENDIDSTTTTVEPGRETAFYTFSAFFYPSEEFCSSDDGGNITDINACKEKVESNGGKWYWPLSWGKDTITLDKLDSSILSGEGSFRNYTQFSDAVAENEASYTFLVSTVAGVFILYVLLNFCFDMAVRVIKLAFYQLIAPIPVICRILPGGKFKETFDTWVKQTVSVYLEVFIRIFVMAISVFLIDLVVTYFNGGELTAQIGNVGFVQKLIIQALLIMAVVIFMKQAPKLIGDLFKLDTGGMKLGLMDKLAMGGALTAGAIAGGGATMFARNTVSGFRKMGANFKEAKGIGKVGAIAGGLIGTAGSVAAGTVSGAARSGKAGLKAKNFKDMSGAASSGAAAAGMAKAKRDAYKASHNVNKEDLGKLGSIPFVGAAAAGTLSSLNTSWGHVKDTVSGVGQWAGISNVQSLIDANKALDDIATKKDAIKDAAQNLILGEAKKNKNKSFGIDSSRTFSNVSSLGLQYSQFNTERLRDLQQRMEIAKQTGSAKDAYGIDVSAQEWENLYGQYLSEFTDEVQNQALQSDEHYKAMIENSGDALGMKADFSALSGAVSEFRRTIKDNIKNPAVVEAKFTLDMVNGKNDLKVKDQAMDDLGKTLKTTKADNIRKINEIRRKDISSDKK